MNVTRIVSAVAEFGSMRSTELNKNGTHERDSQEVSDDTPMYNPLGLFFVNLFSIF